MSQHNIPIPPPPPKKNPMRSTLLYCSGLRTTPIKAFCTQEGRNRLKHREEPRGGVQMSRIPLSYLLRATENN